MGPRHELAWPKARRHLGVAEAVIAVIPGAAVGITTGVLEHRLDWTPVWLAAVVAIGALAVLRLGIYGFYLLRAPELLFREEVREHMRNHESALAVQNQREGDLDALGQLLFKMLDAIEDFQIFHDDAEDPERAQQSRAGIDEMLRRCAEEVVDRLGYAERAFMASAVQSKRSKVTHPYVVEQSVDTVRWQRLVVCAEWLERRLKKMRDV